MDAEKQRTASEKEHLARSAAFSAAEARVKALEKKLSRFSFSFQNLLFGNVPFLESTYLIGDFSPHATSVLIRTS